MVEYGIYDVFSITINNIRKNVHEESNQFTNNKNLAAGRCFLFAIFLLILVWCCLKSVAYIKTRIEKKKQIKNSMYKEYTKKPALVKLF